MELKIRSIPQEDKRYVIWTRPGFTGWAGVGSTAYYPAKHYLSDLSKAKRGSSSFNLFLETLLVEMTGGRFGRSMQRKMFEEARRRAEDNQEPQGEAK